MGDDDPSLPGEKGKNIKIRPPFLFPKIVSKASRLICQRAILGM